MDIVKTIKNFLRLSIITTSGCSSTTLFATTVKFQFRFIKDLTFLLCVIGNAINFYYHIIFFFTF